MTTTSVKAPYHLYLEQAGAMCRNIVDACKRTMMTVEFRILCVVLSALVCWGVAIAIFGYPALILPALAMVPVIFFCLLMITVGN